MEQRRAKVAVLIPAAGHGTRMGGARKQFRSLGGDPLLLQTLRLFERHDEVDALLVAAPADTTGPLEAALRGAGLEKLITIVAGGASRQASVRAALKAAPEDISIILVHDAVRPFVKPAHISNVIHAVQTHGAAALALPVADTLRRAFGTVFGETVPRESLYRMQTPQGFRRDWFEEAHAQALHHNYLATDDVDLVQRAGYTVQIVEGCPRNVKITTPGDWEMAQVLWDMEGVGG